MQLAERTEFSVWEYLLTTRPGIGWVKGSASLTGVVLQVVICLMVLCSSTFVRRSGHFEVRVNAAAQVLVAGGGGSEVAGLGPVPVCAVCDRPPLVSLVSHCSTDRI